MHVILIPIPTSQDQILTCLFHYYNRFCFFKCQVQKLCTNYKYYYWIWVVLNIDGYSLLVSSLIPYIKKLQLVLNQTDTFPMSLRKRPIHRSQIHSHARSKSRVLMHNIPITRHKICRVTNLKSPYAFLYFI